MTFIIGHRGARNEAPENTIEGFRHAAENGCRAFELDIQLSKDHELVVFHDSTLKRMTGTRGDVAKKKMSELNSFDAGRNSFWPSPCKIPTLSEVVDSVPDTSDWQLEVKPTSHFLLNIIARKISAFLLENSPAGRVTVTSSSHYFLSIMKARSPETRTGLVAEFPNGDIVSSCKKLGCELLAINQKICSPQIVEEASQHELEVSVWTVNDLDRIDSFRRFGVASVITDIPSIAISATI